jgi:hypothetical protein
VRRSIESINNNLISINLLIDLTAEGVIMFTPTKSTGKHCDGIDFEENTYPCGCSSYTTWIKESTDDYGHENTFEACDKHDFHTYVDPMRIRYLKRAMVDNGLTNFGNLEWEILIKSMQSPRFRVIVDETRKEIEDSEVQSPKKKQKTEPNKTIMPTPR